MNNFIFELKNKDPMRIGQAGTILFLVLVLILAFLPNELADGGRELRVLTFMKAPPNEVGDTLAGIAGALAFLWIIVTVMLQSKELAEQREELKLARHESAKMAAALQTQSEIFLDEQKQRKALAAEKELNQRLEFISVLLSECSLNGSSKERDKTGLHALEHISFKTERFEDVVDDYLRRFSYEVLNFRRNCDQFLESFELQAPFPKQKKFEQIIEQISCVRELRTNLGSDQIARLERIRLAALQENLRPLMELPIWKSRRKSSYVEPVI